MGRGGEAVCWGNGEGLLHRVTNKLVNLGDFSKSARSA